MDYKVTIKKVSIIDGKRNDLEEKRILSGDFSDVVQEIKDEYVKDPEHTKEYIHKEFGHAKWKTEYNYGNGNKTGCLITMYELDDDDD